MVNIYIYCISIKNLIIIKLFVFLKRRFKKNLINLIFLFSDIFNKNKIYNS